MQPEFITQGGHEFAVLDWYMDWSKVQPRKEFLDVPSLDAEDEEPVYSKKQKTKAKPAEVELA
jgi:hypothetical protein